MSIFTSLLEDLVNITGPDIEGDYYFKRDKKEIVKKNVRLQVNNLKMMGYNDKLVIKKLKKDYASDAIEYAKKYIQSKFLMDGVRYMKKKLNEEFEVGDKVEVNPAYGGGTGMVTEIPAREYVTVAVNGRKKYYHESDLTLVAKAGEYDDDEEDDDDYDYDDEELEEQQNGMTKVTIDNEAVYDYVADNFDVQWEGDYMMVPTNDIDRMEDHLLSHGYEPGQDYQIVQESAKRKVKRGGMTLESFKKKIKGKCPVDESWKVIEVYNRISPKNRKAFAKLPINEMLKVSENLLNKKPLTEGVERLKKLAGI